jgi:phosphoenolpyruvate synthase/pyruvate phosphate dikinase
MQMDFEKIKLTEKPIGLDKNPDYFFFVARESCLMRDEIYNRWAVDHGVKSALFLPSGQTTEYYHDRKSFFDFLNKYAKKMQVEWRSHISSYPTIRRRLVKSAQAVSLAAKTKDRSSVLSAYRAYVKVAYDFSEYILSPWPVIHIIEPEFYKKFPEAEIIGTLEKPIEFLKMQSAARKMTPKKLEQEFGWLNVYNPFDEPYSQADFKKIIEGLNLTEIDDHIKTQKKNKTEFKKFLKTLPECWRLKAKIIHQYAFLKTDRIDAWKISMSCLTDLCRYLTDLRSDMTPKDASFLSVQEVIALLEGQSPIVTKEIKLRSKNKAAYLLVSKQESVFYSMAEIKRIKAALEVETKEVKEINGLVACKGRAKGKAIIINHSNDIKKVRRNDIIIARYTFPSFTPYMKIASAIITDEGGLTSHAAIVAREFNIPCIIGTKIATKVLKDGDLVEVDANNGVVYISKRA